MRYGFGIIKGKAVVAVAVLVRPPKRNICVNPFGARGDSGALVFDYKAEVIGIYIGGQESGDEKYSAVDPPIKQDLAVGGIDFISPIGPNLDSIRAAVQEDPEFHGASVDPEFLWGSSDGFVDGYTKVSIDGDTNVSIDGDAKVSIDGDAKV